MRDRILVVDDDEGIQAGLRRLLRRAGYDVLLAGGLEDALVQLRADEGVVSFALVDLNLDDVRGEFAVRVLHSLMPTLPIATMSGGHRTGDGLPGVCGHLVKPFPFEDLLALLCHHLGS
jgi:two-component system response regulator PrrA